MQPWGVFLMPWTEMETVRPNPNSHPNPDPKSNPNPDPDPNPNLRCDPSQGVSPMDGHTHR